MSKARIVVKRGLARRELEVDSSLKDLDLSGDMFTGIDLGFVREMDSLEVLNLRKNEGERHHLSRWYNYVCFSCLQGGYSGLKLSLPMTKQSQAVEVSVKGFELRV